MNDNPFIPRILIIDDLFGRTHSDQRNEERSHLCGNYLLNDITGDEVGKGTPKKIKKPLAQAVFYRGQKPICSDIGDVVENDLDGTLKVLVDCFNATPFCSLVLLDLCFYTGKVTEKSDKKTKGMPESRSGDDDPKQYFGLKILSKIKEKFPELPVVILSSKPEEEIGLDYSRLGALGFIPRADGDGPELLKEHLYRNALIPDEFSEIIGNSKALLYALRDIRRSAAQGGKRNILFQGETGTGKRLFARYAHRQRTMGIDTVPYYVVNCPQVNPSLFASELFGHKKGSFTDAREDKQGVFEKANGGDVLLDEIADLPQAVQAGILKIIEERVFTRLGETALRSTDVRFLSSTSSDLTGIREDLLMRLTEAGTITLPPLRDRKDDFPVLVEKFVRDAERVANARKRIIEDDTILKLQIYSWPGNVRELENCIYTAVQQYSRVPYLVPEHIHFPDQYFESHTKNIEETSRIVESGSATLKGFAEFELPQILQEQHKTIAKYIIKALEHTMDRRNAEPNYPKTWHAMTGQNIKNSSTCQRNIGNYIFQLSNEDIMAMMERSNVFRKAVFQCGGKIQSAKKRLPDLKNFLE